MPYSGWLIVSALCFAVGEYLSKRFVLSPQPRWVLAVLLAYNCGTLAWLPALLKRNQLSVVGTMWSVLSLTATVLIGVFLFRESLTTTHVVGLGFAFLAVFLLSLG